MATEVTNGPELARQSWEVLRDNQHLLWFPFISGTLIVVLTPASTFFLGALANLIGEQLITGQATVAVLLVWLVLMYLCFFVGYFCFVFFNVALVGAVMKLMRGEQATVRDGLAIALSKMRKILIYAAISATVGIVVRVVRYSGFLTNDRGTALATILAGGAIQGAWDLLVFLAIPVLIAEDIGVVRAIRRGISLFKESWDEDFSGSPFVGFLSIGLYIAIAVAGGLLCLYGVWLGSSALLILTVFLMFTAFTILVVLESAVNGVLQAAMYQYATTGDAGPFVSTEDAADAFWTI